ncbi:hypothetical protein DXG01_004136, partial [Tephrocybe rancida]
MKIMGDLKLAQLALDKIEVQHDISPNFSWMRAADLIVLGKRLWFCICKLDIAPDEDDIPSFILG